MNGKWRKLYATLTLTMKLMQTEREHEVEGRRCLFSLVWMHIGSELVHYMFNFKQKRNFFEFVKCLQQLYS